MTSSRYSPAICLMLALALVPTIIHGYAGFVVKDSLTTRTIDRSLAGFSSTDSTRDAGWGKREFESPDWIDRTYRSGPDEIKLTVVRSYDLTRLYHHPELAIAYGTSLPRHEIRRFAQRPDTPVHVLRSEIGGGFALYAMHYDGQFVADPIVFHLRAAGAMLATPRKAMTLFFLRPVRAAGDTEAEMQRASELLFAAIKSFVAGSPTR